MLVNKNLFNPGFNKDILNKGFLDIKKQADNIMEFGINMSLVNSKMNHSGEFEFLFINNVYPIKFTGLGTITKIDKNKLKQKLEAFVKPTDKKYIKLKEFTHMKSIFIFDYESWFDDSFKTTDGLPFASMWDRKFKLKVIPPYFTRVYAMRLDIGKYIETYFKKYIEKRPQMRKMLVKHIPNELFKVLGTQPEALFNYQYDYSSNCIIARLKSEYIALIAYSYTKLTNKNMFGFKRI